jgi:hypothetical protein
MVGLNEDVRQHLIGLERKIIDAVRDFETATGCEIDWSLSLEPLDSPALQWTDDGKILGSRYVRCATGDWHVVWRSKRGAIASAIMLRRWWHRMLTKTLQSVARAWEVRL